MNELINSSYKLHFFIGFFLVVIGLSSLFLIISTVRIDNFQGSSTGSASTVLAASGYEDSPNIIAGGMATLTDTLDQFVVSSEHKLINILISVKTTATKSIKSVAAAFVQSTKFVLRITYKVIVYAAAGFNNSLSFIVNSTGKIIGSVTKKPVLSSLIRPAESVEAPVIDSQLSAWYAAHADSATKDLGQASTLQNNVEAIWPLHGKVTTLFGEQHRPYQATHTGIDIRSGLRSGLASIKPFRSGHVIDILYTKRGLGNYLIVDHGRSLTSVYGHLYSISVKVGQPVDQNTVLGYEGSTGTSTGTHLHFEIRLNGQPIDPKRFITGHP